MKRPHAPAAALLLAALLAPVCAAQRRADSRRPPKEPAGSESPVELARRSGRTILVSVDPARNVYFGDEKLGTADDTALLRERVRRAVERNLRAAEEDGEDVKGGRVVFMCAPDSFRYGDIVKVIEAVREAGGDPLGLRTEPGGCGRLRSGAAAPPLTRTTSARPPSRRASSRPSRPAARGAARGARR